jgi:hypothetical protein
MVATFQEKLTLTPLSTLEKVVTLALLHSSRMNDMLHI